MFVWSRLWKKSFDIKGASENEDVLAGFSKLFTELDKDENLKKIFFEYDFRNLGILADRPFVVKSRPPNIFESSSLKRHFHVISLSSLNPVAKRILDILIRTEILKEDEFVWIGCRNDHLTFVSRRQVGSKPHCGSCTNRPSTLHPFYYINPRITGVLSNPGKILEPFVLWKATELFKMSKSIKLYWGPYLHYKHKIKRLEKGKQEIDILIECGNKRLIILTSINPAASEEKKQYHLCRKLGFETLFITTKDYRSSSSYSADGQGFFREIHRDKPAGRLLRVIKNHFIEK